MMQWVAIWKVVLLASLAVFALVTLITAIFGARDVRRLFQRLEDERHKNQK